MSLILRVAARGDGVADDGRHAPLSAPGDTLNDSGKVIPGPHHQVPPCRHFPDCGGCQLQQLDDESYAAFVADRIASALHAQGLAAPLRPTILSPPRTRRRATFHAERGLLGFTAQASHQIVDMRECHVLAPALFDLAGPLRALFQKLGLKRRADVHLALADQGADILITGFSPQGLAAAEALTVFCKRYGVARLSIDDGLGPETRWEPQPVTITLGGIPVAFPPGGFLQATQEGEDALVAAVREAVGQAKGVADLFAGLGTFTLALSARVYAAEGARNPIASLKSAAAMRGRPVFTEHRDLFRRPLTAAELNRFGAVVLDPPRAGAREQAAALAECRVTSIAYVSCNPSSFARDARAMVEGGWRIEWIQPVGQFRWSTHVELAARFVR